MDAATLGADLDLQRFGAFGELTIFQETNEKNAEAHLKGADIAVLNKVRLTADILATASSLKLICVAATGYDNIDIPYCREHHIAVCNVIGYSTQCVAQLTLTMALSLMTNTYEYGNFVRSGDYTKSGIPNRLTPVFHEIFGKTWGILGYGNIGKQVAKSAESFGCKILVCKRTPIEERQCVDLDQLCRESDILSIHTPLNQTTRNLLDREHIKMLKPTAIVINVARGAVADEQALADAIREKRIGGIGIDVYSREPFPKEHPFYDIRQFPNVLLTPHMAWGGYETRCRLVDEMISNIQIFLSGGLKNRVDL